MSSHDMKVGIGMPPGAEGEPKEVLSAEEEKKVDEHGKRVVDEAPWSYVPTGLYLTVFGSEHREDEYICDRAYWGDCLALRGITLGIFVTRGRPKFTTPGMGCSLELPSDLARDALKKTYLTEWIIESTKEILKLTGGRIPGKNINDFATWLVVTADQAIRRSGL